MSKTVKQYWQVKYTFDPRDDVEWCFVCEAENPFDAIRNAEDNVEKNVHLISVNRI